MKEIALIILMFVCLTISGQTISQPNNRYRGVVAGTDLGITAAMTQESVPTATPTVSAQLYGYIVFGYNTSAQKLLRSLRK